MPCLTSKASLILATHPLKFAHLNESQVVHLSHALLNMVAVIDIDACFREDPCSCHENPEWHLQHVRSQRRTTAGLGEQRGETASAHKQLHE